MIYDVRHRTTYSYEAPVSFARCTLRLTPIEEAGQSVIATQYRVTPTPATQAERTSFFGHREVALTLESMHRQLVVDARSRVAVHRKPIPDAGKTPAWELVRDEVHASRSMAPSSPVHYVYPSRLIPLLEPVTQYARQSFPKGRSMLEGATELMNRIKADFEYDRKATLVSTPLGQAFGLRKGVCQDFAHLMIAGLRGVGLPAAYVSGYIRTVPPPGKKRLEGADATHAWVSVWCCDDIGWVGLDPTNGIGVADDHIVLSLGRDYADISPIDGVILGSGSQKLKVEVDVVPVDDPDASSD